MRNSPKYLPAAERRAATVEAVIDLAADRVPAEITTTAIAERMGLTQGALFKHFPTKDAILVAVMDWVARNLMLRVEKAAQGAAPLIALERLFIAHVEFVAAHPGVPRLVFGELQRTERSAAGHVVQALLKSYGARVAQILAEAEARGDLDPDVDVEAAALFFVGTVQGLVMQSSIHGEVARMRSDAARVFAIYRRGIERAQ